MAKLITRTRRAVSVATRRIARDTGRTVARAGRQLRDNFDTVRRGRSTYDSITGQAGRSVGRSVRRNVARAGRRIGQAVVGTARRVGRAALVALARASRGLRVALRGRGAAGNRRLAAAGGGTGG